MTVVSGLSRNTDLQAPAAPVVDLMTPAWTTSAVCASTDPEAFFPEKGGSTREAKEVCAVCPVAAECLDWALDHDVRFGIWGGLSERERRAIASNSGARLPGRTGGDQ